MIDLTNPLLLGPVQNQEHYMNGVVAHRTAFCEPILPMLEAAYEEFGALTGRHYGLLSKYRVDDADTVFVSLGSAAENIEAAVDYLRDKGEKVGSIHLNVLRPMPEAAYIAALAGRKNVIIWSAPTSRWPVTTRWRATSAPPHEAPCSRAPSRPMRDAEVLLRRLWPGFARFPARGYPRRLRVRDRHAGAAGRQGRRRHHACSWSASTIPTP
jgi:hypothetical protein